MCGQLAAEEKAKSDVSLPTGPDQRFVVRSEEIKRISKYPGLLFPGKDDKLKDPRKVRARICFQRLRAIANWRVQTIWDCSKQKSALPF